MLNHYPFELPPIPYGEADLEPYIDAETVNLHYYKHFKGYIDTLNMILENHPRLQSLSLEQLLGNINRLPVKIQTDIRNNAGGVYNHNLYFHAMGPDNNQPFGECEAAIRRSFGSMDAFQRVFLYAGTKQFGSGWVWLVADQYHNLRVVTTDNQNTLVGLKLYPILLMDVWEHAYYLKYKNQRRIYEEAWLRVIDWAEAEKKYLDVLRRSHS